MSRYGIYDLHDGFIPNDDSPKKKTITNADRIRSMTDEEIANILDNTCVENIGEVRCDSCRRCYDCWLEWLKEEAKT